MIFERLIRRHERCVNCQHFTFWKGCVGGCLNPPRKVPEALGTCCGLYRRAGFKKFVLGVILFYAERWYTHYLIETERKQKDGEKNDG